MSISFTISTPPGTQLKVFSVPPGAPVDPKDPSISYYVQGSGVSSSYCVSPGVSLYLEEILLPTPPTGT